ncbi:3076_t:CDS:2, partial [Gigaspora rosea]
NLKNIDPSIKVRGLCDLYVAVILTIEKIRDKFFLDVMNYNTKDLSLGHLELAILRLLEFNQRKHPKLHRH